MGLGKAMEPVNINGVVEINWNELMELLHEWELI